MDLEPPIELEPPMDSRERIRIRRFCKYLEHSVGGYKKYYKIVDDLLLYVHEHYHYDENMPLVDPQAEYEEYDFTPRIGNLILHVLYKYHPNSEYKRMVNSIVLYGQNGDRTYQEIENRVYDAVNEVARLLQSDNPMNHIKYYAFVAELYWMFHYEGQDEQSKNVSLFSKMAIHKYRRHFIQANVLDAFAKERLEYYLL